MPKIKHLLLLLAFISSLHANTPPQTTYNENNQPLVIEYADGNTIIYEYDAAGRTTSTKHRGQVKT